MSRLKLINVGALIGMMLPYMGSTVATTPAPTPLPRVDVTGSVVRMQYTFYYPYYPPASSEVLIWGGPLSTESFESFEEAANRKQPSCERERNFLDLVKAEAQAGRPMNNPYSISGFAGGLSGFISDITDFLGSGGPDDVDYQGGDWRKMEVAFQYFDVNTKTTVFLMAHYFWHQYTNEVKQLKLKNTKAQGCAGQATYVG